MKPTDKELAHAVEVAEQMILSDSDPDYLARCVTYMHRRNGALEEVFIHLERYLQFGTPTDEHAKLTVLVQRLREQALIGGGDTELDYGL